MDTQKSTFFFMRASTENRSGALIESALPSLPSAEGSARSCGKAGADDGIAAPRKTDRAIQRGKLFLMRFFDVKECAPRGKALPAILTSILCACLASAKGSEPTKPPRVLRILLDQAPTTLNP